MQIAGVGLIDGGVNGSACDTGIPVSQAAAINSLRMANALLAPGSPA